MKLYQVSPKKDVKRLTILTVALLLGGIIMLVVSAFLDYKQFKPIWPFQLVGIGMLGLGIFFLVRYLKKVYVYALEQTDNGLDLTVTEVNGRHAVTVCRISKANIEEIYVACPSDSLQMKKATEKAKSGKRKQFNYTVDMFGEKCIFLLVTECGEPLAIRLSYDEELMRLLEAKE